jgi:EF hand
VAETGVHITDTQESKERNMRTLFIAAGLLAGMAGIAVANEPYFPRGQRAFDRADADKDGKVALSEFAPLADRRMARMDVNNDKAVSAAEIEARMQESLKKRRDRIMALMDLDKDGKITESELGKTVEAMFNDADADKDGGLTMVEMKNFKRGTWRKAYLQQTGGN